MFDNVNLPSGEKINAIADGSDLILYITDERKVYKATLSDYGGAAYLSMPPRLFYHCDEICPFSDGTFLTRKNDNINHCA